MTFSEVIFNRKINQKPFIVKSCVKRFLWMICEYWDQCRLVALRLIVFLLKNYFAKVTANCACIWISFELYRSWRYWCIVQLLITVKSPVKEMSQYLKSLRARFHISISVNELRFHKISLKIFLKTLHMYVCTFSSTFTVTNNPPISETHVCASSTFLVTSSRPFSKACVAKVTRVFILQSLVFLKAESSLHFGFAVHRFFTMVGAIMILKPFYVIIGSKVSSIYH